MFKKLLSVLFFLFLMGSTLAQNCQITTATTKVCLGNTLLFNVSFDNGFTATSYQWNFGNGATSTQASPVYQYPAIGTFTPSVTITFSNNTTCNVNGQVITVVGNPVADFVLTTEDTQCFKGNNFCINDLSVPGQSNAPISSRIILWGDGNFNNSSPSFNPVCYSYTNPLGGSFPIVVEVTDANNCTSRKEVQRAATVWSKMQDVSFNTNYTIQCNQTPVTFINTSKIPQSMIKSFLWEFGDGNTNTTNWNNFIHTYTQTGSFAARLTVIDINGCADTFRLNPAGINARIDDVIYLSSNNSCFRNNLIQYESKNVSQAFTAFVFFNNNGQRLDSLITSVGNYRFPTCGRFKISMYVRLGNCNVKRDTFIDIYGPDAVAERIDSVPARIQSSIQCEIYDTVYFRTPTIETSCWHLNDNMFYLWDFNDPFAPPCTTYTKLNQNVGVNCRYSRDSINVKHFYQPGKEQCYYPSLIMTDMVRGCTDTSITALKLTQPDAGWDSTVNPVRRGLYYTSSGFPCLESPIRFWLDETLPLCGREKAWINLDSACGKNNWVLIDTLKNFHDHVYTNTCDSSGWVTVGLIIKNGFDKNGKPCYDTAWYHKMFRFFPINPLFTATNLTPGCGPWTFRVSLNDSIQDSIKRVEYRFDTDTSIVYNIAFGDSILRGATHTFNTRGIKRITVLITNTRNCTRTVQRTVLLGFTSSFSLSKNVLCLNDSVQLLDNIRYIGNPTPFWRDTSRARAGKEQVIWDVGDGNGFSKTGAAAFSKYNKVANYPVRMIAIDSLGCRDTIKVPQIVRVVDVKAAIKPMLPRYLCAPQILTFTDESKYFDSSALYGQQPYDRISTWLWVWDDGKPNSIVQNPVHDFTANGTYNVKLIVSTVNGCLDSSTIPIFIDGPKPSFDILSDTFGCAPFTVNFKNTTGYQLQNWIWFFRDQNGAILSTLKDTSVTHTYTKGGIYKIYLLGEDTIFNQTTQQYLTCRSVFPDSLNPASPIRQVFVIERVGANIIGPDTVCLFEPVTFTARTNELFAGYNWNFGNNDSTFTLWPDSTATTVYRQLGSYRIRLIPQGGPAGFCIDTAYKNIVTSDVKADFDIDASEAPLYKFINKSQFAVRYEWDFGQPRSGPRNRSNLENPTHNYGSDTGIFKICLKAYNLQDCFDSICKETEPKVHIYIPNVFTPNNDGTNDAFDIDIQGFTIYKLRIYNRWGDKVFEEDKDGVGNDGINWNGNNFNKGAICPEGVYYFIFTYKLLNMESDNTVRGSVTLIRD
ncbi:MAG: PKD domain-containing protein [Bacteroidia bacterium]